MSTTSTGSSQWVPRMSTAGTSSANGLSLLLSPATSSVSTLLCFGPIPLPTRPR